MLLSKEPFSQARGPAPGDKDREAAGCHVAAQPQEACWEDRCCGVSTEGGIWMGQLAKWQPQCRGGKTVGKAGMERTLPAGQVWADLGADHRNCQGAGRGL